MGRNKQVLPPALGRVLSEVGENIRLARLRRKISAEMLAERAGITRTTLRAIERGEPSPAFGIYAMVLFCLGLDKDLKVIARDDDLGRKLQDVGVTVKKRAQRLSSKIDEAKKSDE